MSTLQRHIKSMIFVVFLSSIFVLGLVGNVQAQECSEATLQRDIPHYSYNFRKIADNGPGSPYADVTGQGINDKQDIVFTVTLREGGQAIYQTDKHGRHLTTIAKSGALIKTFTQLPFINDTGQVSFAAELQNGATAIFRAEVEEDEDGEDGEHKLTRIADTEPGSPFSSLPPPAARIRHDGDVVFRGFLHTGQVGFFSGYGGPLRTWYLTGEGEYTDFPASPGAQVHGHKIAFRAIVPGGEMGAFFGDGEVEVETQTIALTGDEFTTFRSGFEANDCDVLTLPAELRAGGMVLYVVKEGKLTPFVDTTRGYATLASQPGGVSINNDGAIMFIATLDGGGEGIFQGPDIVADKVIMTGDELFGSTVANFNIGAPMNPRGLNAHGWLIFRVRLADGRTVIGLGKPTRNDASQERDDDDEDDDEGEAQ